MDDSILPVLNSFVDQSVDDAVWAFYPVLLAPSLVSPCLVTPSLSTIIAIIAAVVYHFLLYDASVDQSEYLHY